ncbi:Protein CWC15 [Thelohanellus kitauei]|uniref:Protein CWC15 n=1 Tax=Thelohanellus kitauei TaxID=669202 RepID=A0A0C2JQV7_THEKT|nr:Protein CWC15 [Thelohanellus kitauei]
MTTAGKATFDPARGGSGKNEKSYTLLSKQFSSRDMPGQLKLKSRVPGQDTQEELKLKNFRQELIEREAEAKRKREAALAAESAQVPKELEVGSSDSEVESDDDEAETAALLAELQRIREERAEVKAKKEAEEREQAEKNKVNSAISGNPLLDPEQSNFLVKRKWNDDVIFKNCAKDRDKKQKPYFINDMIRSDFHRRFMDRYVK